MRLPELVNVKRYPHKWPKDDYIPESLFYLSGFKAGNERVIKYQQWMFYIQFVNVILIPQLHSFQRMDDSLSAINITIRYNFRH